MLKAISTENNSCLWIPHKNTSLDKIGQSKVCFKRNHARAYKGLYEAQVERMQWAMPVLKSADC